MLVLLGGGLAVAGCGSEDEDKGEPIPANTAVLQAQLDNTQARIDGGNLGACEDILGGPRGPNMPQVQELIDALPEGVSADVRTALQDGFDHLWGLVQECDELRASREQQDDGDGDGARRPRRLRRRRRRRDPDRDGPTRRRDPAAHRR